MLNFIQATILAAKNRSRVARILREIDEPRKQAIAEARLSFKQYQDAIAAEGMGWTSCGTAKQMKRH